jgi:hypothetical protein
MAHLRRTREEKKIADLRRQILALKSLEKQEKISLSTNGLGKNDEVRLTANKTPMQKSPKNNDYSYIIPETIKTLVAVVFIFIVNLLIYLGLEKRILLNPMGLW